MIFDVALQCDLPARSQGDRRHRPLRRARGSRAYRAPIAARCQSLAPACALLSALLLAEFGFWRGETKLHEIARDQLVGGRRRFDRQRAAYAADASGRTASRSPPRPSAALRQLANRRSLISCELRVGMEHDFDCVSGQLPTMSERPRITHLDMFYYHCILFSPPIGAENLGRP